RWNGDGEAGGENRDSQNGRRWSAWTRHDGAPGAGRVDHGSLCCACPGPSILTSKDPYLVFCYRARVVSSSGVSSVRRLRRNRSARVRPRSCGVGGVTSAALSASAALASALAALASARAAEASAVRSCSVVVLARSFASS